MKRYIMSITCSFFLFSPLHTAHHNDAKEKASYMIAFLGSSLLAGAAMGYLASHYQTKDLREKQEAMVQQIRALEEKIKKMQPSHEPFAGSSH